MQISEDKRITSEFIESALLSRVTTIKIYSYFHWNRSRNNSTIKIVELIAMKIYKKYKTQACLKSDYSLFNQGYVKRKLQNIKIQSVKNSNRMFLIVWYQSL